jgi:hypothetical protein
MCLLPSRLSNKNFVAIYDFTMCATYPARLILLDFITVVILGKEYKL